MKSLLLFWREAIRKPGSIGAFGPSSPFVAKAMTMPLKGHKQPSRVLEVGPGTGAVTEAILENLTPADTLDLCELNPEFVKLLRERFESRGETGPRVTVFEGDVLEKAGAQYDYIISSVPASNLPPEVVQRLLEGLISRLAPGGVLACLHYRGQDIRSRLAIGKERDRLRQVIQIIKTYQRRHGVGKDTVWLSLPPAEVHYLTRDPAAQTKMAGARV
jgi:phospholipid N-methyltransferase